MKWIWSVVTAIIVLIVAVTFWAYLGWGMWAFLASANLGIVLAVFSLLLYSIMKNKEEEKAGFSIKDERTISLEERADSRAFHVSMWFMVALMFFCVWQAEVQRRQEYLPALIMLILSLCVMIGVRFVFRHYLKEKGEMER
jgi:uncharacterized membrane protein